MTEQVTNNSVSLTLNDFIVVVNLIDACSKRGAFNGDELASVGQLRDRFVSFINANKPANTESPSTDIDEQK